MLDIDIAQRVQVKFIPLGDTRWWSWVGAKTRRDSSFETTYD